MRRLAIFTAALLLASAGCAKSLPAKTAQPNATAAPAGVIKQPKKAPRTLLAFPGEEARGRFVPERKDDFAWENDRIAFRVYGPALQKKDGPQSGIDVWVKSVRRPVIDRWYAGKNYHRDHGEGLDYYKVGRSRGCGGLGIWDGTTLHTSGNFDSWKILDSGPKQFRFRLTFPSWKAGDRTVQETRTISLGVGSNLNRIESVFESDSPNPLVVGIGIARRKGGKLIVDRKSGLLSYWEPPHPKHGSIGCAVLVDPASIAGFADTKTDHLILVRATPGRPLVYHAGATWSKGLDFTSAKAWTAHVRGEAAKLWTPAKIDVDL